MYAQTLYSEAAAWISFYAITLSPYMGNDAVTPYLAYADKCVIVLALTSSKGSKDFQYLETGDGFLYEAVIKKANTWAGADRMMFVVGATKSTEFPTIGNHARDNFLLVPGV